MEPFGLESEKDDELPERSRLVESSLMFSVFASITGAILCIFFWGGPERVAEFQLCTGTTDSWAAMNGTNFEMWDFVLEHRTMIASDLLNENKTGKEMGRKFGVVDFSYKRYIPGEDSVSAPNQSAMDLQDGKVYLRTHFTTRPQAKNKGKKPLNMEFVRCFKGMTRLALAPVRDECTGIVEIVASQLYQKTKSSGPGAIPIRLFHGKKFLGLYIAVDWATDQGFLERMYPGTRDTGTSRLWEGMGGPRAGDSLEFVGSDPVLYQNDCQGKGCPYCGVQEVGGRLTCNEKEAVRDDCKKCRYPYKVFQGEFCCNAYNTKPGYKLLIEEPKPEPKDDPDEPTTSDAFSDLAMLIDAFNDIRPPHEESSLRRLENMINVDALLESMAVDLMVGNFGGFWGNGRNYFLYQWGSEPTSDDIGRFNLFQLDFEQMFAMPPTGGQYNSSYTVQWKFPSELSMCCMPEKEMKWPRRAKQGNGVLDLLIAVPRYRKKFVRTMKYMMKQAPNIADMFKSWSKVIFPSREAELRLYAPKGYSRPAIAHKSLAMCSAENLAPQLQSYIVWISERSAYLTKLVDKLGAGAGLVIDTGGDDTAPVIWWRERANQSVPVTPVNPGGIESPAIPVTPV